VESDFNTVTPTVSVGRAASTSFRRGASLEFPYASISDEGQLSGEVT